MAASSDDFESSAEKVSSGALGNISPSDQLILYAYYCVATKGPAPSINPSSSFLSPRASAKWRAWTDASSLSPEEAKALYVAHVAELPSGDGVAVQGFAPEAALKGFSVPAEVSGASDKPDIGHWAALNDAKSVHFCLRQGAEPDKRDADGLTPLMRAADRGAVDAVRVLLEGGAGTEVADGDGMTALHYAVLCEHADVAGMLVVAGADLEAVDGEGVSCIDGAVGETKRVIEEAARGDWTDSGREEALFAPFSKWVIFAAGLAVIVAIAGMSALRSGYVVGEGGGGGWRRPDLKTASRSEGEMCAKEA